MQRKQKTK